MSSIRLTRFTFESKCAKAIRNFGPSSAAKVLNDIEEFERDWHDGMDDDQLFARYNFKPLHVHRPYGLFQIRVGPKRKSLSYRSVVIFYDGQSSARWIHAFKKEGMSEPQEIELAVARADEFWNTMRGRL